MTNLQLAENFFTDFFGAICFYNDPRDGYVKISDGHRKIETLSVYFPNRVDLNDNETAERLTTACGNDFYKRYVGSKNLLLCGMQGSRLLASFWVDDKVVGMMNFSGVGIKGNVEAIFDYFCGRDLDCLAESAVTALHNVVTNNGQKFEKGMKLKGIADDYLKMLGVDNLRGEGFYTEPTYEYKNFIIPDRQRIYEEINASFRKEYKAISEIAKKRADNFRKLLDLLTEEDWKGFYADMEIKYPYVPTSEDD